MPKEKRIYIRVSSEDKRLLEADAKKEERNLSNLLLWCWKKWRIKKKR